MINCCSPSDPSFTGCAVGTNKEGESAGLRLMYPQQGTYFRLAIEQAEAEFGIEGGEVGDKFIFLRSNTEPCCLH